MICFVCTDKSQPPKDVEHQLDPWTFIEGFPDGQLSSAYFGGQTVERTNYRYIKSPYEAPSINSDANIIMD